MTIPTLGSPAICLLDHDLKTVIDSSMSHSLAFAQAFLESRATIEIWAHRSCDLGEPVVKRVFKLSQGTINRLASRGRSLLFRKINYLLMLVWANLSYFVSLRQIRCPDAILFVSNASPFVAP